MKYIKLGLGLVLTIACMAWWGVIAYRSYQQTEITRGTFFLMAIVVIAAALASSFRDRGE